MGATTSAPLPPTIYYYFQAGFSGRAEGPLLLLEDVGAAYETSSDVAEPKAKDASCFAPPFCKQGELYLSQSTAICQHLGIQFGVAGEPSQAGVMMRALCNGEDFWGEAYRPAKNGKDPAGGAAFAGSERFGKWLVVVQGPLKAGGDYLFGASPTYADYHLLATLRAVQGMYPKAFSAKLETEELTLLAAWMGRMTSRPKIAAFLASPQTLPPLYPSVMNLA